MLAAVCRGFGRPLAIEEVVLDPPGPGEVEVEVAACAVCHSDILYADGAWGGTLPAVYGHEAAGVVRAVGSGVTEVRPGDHVVVTLIRSCGHCPSCSQGAQVTCETRTASAARSHGLSRWRLSQSRRKSGSTSDHARPRYRGSCDISQP